MTVQVRCLHKLYTSPQVRSQWSVTVGFIAWGIPGPGYACRRITLCALPSLPVRVQRTTRWDSWLLMYCLTHTLAAAACRKWENRGPDTIYKSFRLALYWHTLFHFSVWLLLYQHLFGNEKHISLRVTIYVMHAWWTHKVRSLGGVVNYLQIRSSIQVIRVMDDGVAHQRIHQKSIAKMAHPIFGYHASIYGNLWAGIQCGGGVGLVLWSWK